MTRVSVIIPTYNRAHFLGDALESVLAQNYPDLEIIVGDDGSTDDTAAFIARYGERVTYLPLPHRGQPAAPRNAGLAAATGDYIAFLDSDDLFLPNKLALQTPVLDANPDVGIVYSDGIFFNTTPDAPTGHALTGLSTPSGAVFGTLLAANFAYMPLLLVRRSLVAAAGGFNEQPEIIVAEDYDLWLRLALQTKFQFVPGDVAAIRAHAGNISGNTLRNHRAILAILAGLDARVPREMARHATSRHEAYARSHGAIAAVAARQRQWRVALRHAAQALWHTASLPGLGVETIRAWRQRRRVRASGI